MNENFTQAKRFINAYNLLDHSLRTQYNFKTTISFSDLIRRCASLNHVIRTYEDDLIELARLRNAIVHSKNDETIAEPHENVVELIEKIARIISTPPLAIDVIKSIEVHTLSSNETIKNYILQSNRLGHSNIPVIKDNVGQSMMIGVMQKHTFVEAMGKVLESGRGIDEFLSNTTTEQYLYEFPGSQHFAIVSSEITIERVLALLSDRKMASIIVTSDGTACGQLMGIITSADVIDLMKVLEGY